MWSKTLLEEIVPILFSDSKLDIFFESYVTSHLVPKWQIDLEKLTTLVQFRDYVEDISKETNASALVTKLKTSDDRIKTTIDFLQNIVKYSKEDTDFIKFCLEKELDSFFELSKQITKYRPLLKNKREVLESILSEMKMPEVSDFKEFAERLGHKNLLPVIALYASHMRGDVEEMFLHCPMPRIFGAPSGLRNSLVRKTNVQKLVRKQVKSLNLEHTIVGNDKSLCYSANGHFKIFPASASLMACLPGLPDTIWTLCPKTLEANVYKCEDTGPKCLLKFDLVNESSDIPNWIDCQRDVNNVLVFSWGFINSLTGSLKESNCFALEEDSLLVHAETKFTDKFLVPEIRNAENAKIDYRDHGNLMSIHHTVADTDSEDRKWMHSYEICFGNYLLMTLNTDARPIEGIYGSAHDFILLSPLSASQNIQQWQWSSSEFKMTKSFCVPKGDWTSVSVVYK